jgi:hypothetical protein
MELKVDSRHIYILQTPATPRNFSVKAENRIEFGIRTYEISWVSRSLDPDPGGWNKK